MTIFAHLRELIGWILLGIGLATFGLAGFLIMSQRQACSGIAVSAIGYFVFRGGMNLIKLAVAAKAAADVRQPNVSLIPTRTVRRPVVMQQNLAEPKKNVIPGPGEKR